MANSCHLCSTSLPSSADSCPSCGATPPILPAVEARPRKHPTLDEALLLRLRAATAGEFKVFEEIGRGGMARVYLGHEIVLDREVALKVISPLFGDYPEIVRRFQREARTAAQLSHPNILPVFAVYRREGLSFFSMPYVSGVSLRALIDRKESLPYNKAIDYVLQAAAALAYAHDQGVVHRDVKPANVLLEEPRGRILLMDFGMAKVLGGESLTLPGDSIGTPRYMSPEQCGGRTEVDARSDQYSLALLAYELLAGRHPFGKASFRELVMKQLNEDPPTLEEQCPRVPANVSRAIERALSKDLTRRFPSVSSFAAALVRSQQSVNVESLERRAERVVPDPDDETRQEREHSLRSQKPRRKLRKLTAVGSTAAALAIFAGFVAILRGGSSDGSDPGSAISSFALVGPPTPSGVSIPGPDESTSPTDARSEGTEPPRPVPDPSTETEIRLEPTLSDRNNSRPSQRFSNAEVDLANGDLETAAGEAEPELINPMPGDGGANAGGAGIDEIGIVTDELARAPDSASVLRTETGEDTDVLPAQALAALLERYRVALENEDLNALRSDVYQGEIPASDLKTLGTIFDNADQLEVELRLPDLDVEGDLAKFKIEHRLRFLQAPTNRERTYRLQFTMTFANGPDGWHLIELRR